MLHWTDIYTATAIPHLQVIDHACLVEMRQIGNIVDGIELRWVHRLQGEEGDRARLI
jgi:hypothetical protein